MSGNPEIVATLGPASRKLISELRDAGATAFRINASHMTPAEVGLLAAPIRERLADFPIVVDLQGAKMRLGSFAERRIRMGERVLFSLHESGNAVPLPHQELFRSVSTGETLSCDDGRLRFRIAAAGGDAIEAVSLSEGRLRPRKGVNLVEHPVELSGITPSDAACIEATAALGRVCFALSFMKDGREAEWIRRRAPGCPVIGKIERAEAARDARSIAGLVDALWICRGDLGAQLGMARMARWIGEFDPSDAPCAVLMAGQVLEHLTSHPEPTRSEVCHLFDLVKRGYAGFVLSDETAVGADPVNAVRLLHDLLNSFDSPGR